MPITLNDDSVSKSLLRERIETKLEEFKESWGDTDLGPYPYDRGIIQGLELALEVIGYKN